MPSPDDHARLAEQDARDLLEAGDVPAAREVTEKALRTWPDRPELLWLLADVEFADGDQQAGVCCLAKAFNASRRDADAISRSIRALSENELWHETLMTVEYVRAKAVDASRRDAEAITRSMRALSENELWHEALLTVENIPEEVYGDALVRTAIGDFYKTVKCYAHAVSSYGSSSGLSLSTREQRRLSWLRSGGPFIFARNRIDAWEDSKLLSELYRDRRIPAQLGAVPDLDSRQAYKLKVRLENGYYEYWFHYELWAAFFLCILRWLLLAFLPVWPILYAIVKTADFISGPPGVVAGTAISAAVAVGLPVLVLRNLVQDDSSLRVNLRLTPALFTFLFVLAVLTEIAVAEGYDHQAMPTAGWWAWVVFGLAVMPAFCACMLILAAILTVLAGRGLNSVTRKYCQVVLLDTFLSILLDMHSPSRQLDLELRQHWSWQLELAARHISRDLLSSRFFSDLGSRDWLKQRAAGWAEALRYMQREIIAPVPGGQAKVEAQLRREARCLATGELGTLAWRQPPPFPSRRTRLAQKMNEILRTVLVAALPLGAVLVSQAVLHFNTGAFRWAVITTGVWALLYVIISLDPTIREKIDTARSLAETLQQARRGGLSDSPPRQHVKRCLARPAPGHVRGVPACPVPSPCLGRVYLA